MLKKVLCMLLALAALSSHAFADGYVNVKPGKNDLTKAQVKAFIVSFFAEKCGVEESVLRKADWSIKFGHSTVETAEDAIWSVYTKIIKGHSGVHAMQLPGSGEIIYWSARVTTRPTPTCSTTPSPSRPCPLTCRLMR